MDLDEIKESLIRIGKNIAKKGLPMEFAPYVFGITSKGRVAQGAMEVLELFPHEYVEPEMLDNIPKDDNTKIYIVVLTAKDLVEPIDESLKDKDFDKQHYYDNPSLYKSKFHNYYDKITFLVNCMYWESKFPRNIIEEELCAQKDMKFLGFTDISADYEGSIQVTREFSNIEDPFNLYCPKTRTLKSQINEYEPGDILYHCVDHLPAEMPIEASKHFGEKLLPYLIELVNSDTMQEFSQTNDLPEVIKHAIICCGGKLTPNYRYIEDLRRLKELQKRELEEIKSMKKKSKGLKRAISFESLSLKGHLFDTRFLNDATDMLVVCNVNYRILNIVCGQRNEEPSSLRMQIFSQNLENLNSALEQLYDLAEKKDIKVSKNYESDEVSSD